MELFTSKNTDYRFQPEEFDFAQTIQVCGVDEAGRGPLAGPLSLALVSFSQDNLKKILTGRLLEGLDDSKKLTEKKRELLYSEILLHADLAIHQFISNKFIDKFGISYSIFSAIQKLILKAKITNLYLLVDGNYNFKKHQLDNNFAFSYRSIVKGDSKIASIAAASIIAKVRRDRFMNAVSNKYPNYGFDKHKGYGTAYHIAKIKEHGSSPIHRISFQLKEGAHGT